MNVPSALRACMENRTPKKIPWLLGLGVTLKGKNQRDYYEMFLDSVSKGYSDLGGMAILQELGFNVSECACGSHFCTLIDEALDFAMGFQGMEAIEWIQKLSPVPLAKGHINKLILDSAAMHGQRDKFEWLKKMGVENQDWAADHHIGLALSLNNVAALEWFREEGIL